MQRSGPSLINTDRDHNVDGDRLPADHLFGDCQWFAIDPRELPVIKRTSHSQMGANGVSLNADSQRLDRGLVHQQRGAGMGAGINAGRALIRAKPSSRL